MNIEEISLLHIGSQLMPDGGPLNSSIKIISVNEQGFRFRRCHSYYNGEEFFLTRDALIKSQWILVPEGTQLLLFYS
jgi:hypothetical protein